MKELEKNQSLFNFQITMFDKLKLSLNNEEKAKFIKRIASFAWNNYCGTLYSPKLEQEIIKLGKSLNQDNKKIKNNNLQTNKFKIAHIATELYNVGGHTRVLLNWVEQDNINENHLILTRQNATLSNNLIQRINNTFDSIIKLKNNQTIIDKANFLRKIIIEKNYNIIVLHIHPNDLIPLIAIQFKNRPKIFYYNHADHVFNLGTSLVDLVIDFRKQGKEYSLLRRGAQASTVLPYPLATNNAFESEDSELSYSKYDTILVTMASAYKYKPTQSDNFFAFYSEFLKERKNILMMVIGVSKDDYISFSGLERPPDNMLLMGVVENPTKYIKKADYFIEPFPLGTGLGLVEALKLGAFPIFNYIDYSIYRDSVYTLFPSSFKVLKTNNKNEYLSFIEKEFKKQEIKKLLHNERIKFIKSCLYPEWFNNIQKLYKIGSFSGYGINSIDIKINKPEKKHEYLVAQFFRQPLNTQFSYLKDLWYTKMNLKLRIILIVKVLVLIWKLKNKTFAYKTLKLFCKSFFLIIRNKIKIIH